MGLGVSGDLVLDPTASEIKSEVLLLRPGNLKETDISLRPETCSRPISWVLNGCRIYAPEACHPDTNAVKGVEGPGLLEMGASWRPADT